MARKLCSICETRAVGTGRVDSKYGVGDYDHAISMGYCRPCLAEAEWENIHSDYGHELGAGQVEGVDQGELDACWECHPELNVAQQVKPVRTGHTNTRAHSHNSHAGHGHVLTPTARRVCRASIAAGNGPWNGTR